MTMTMPMQMMVDWGKRSWRAPMESKSPVPSAAAAAVAAAAAAVAGSTI